MTTCSKRWKKRSGGAVSASRCGCRRTAESPDRVLDILVENLEVDPTDVFKVRGPIDLARLRQLPTLDRPELSDAPFEPFIPEVFSPQADEDMFAVIRHEDQLLHHPYDSFQPVVELLRKAAVDPDVLAIKMTLYRVGTNSPIVKALLDAIEHGKQVAVLVELKARFDEESNIEWARALEREGVHVVYGLVGLKVHCKIALIVRREADGIRRYVHLGTGNYNPATARLYTDLSLFTANEEIGYRCVGPVQSADRIFAQGGLPAAAGGAADHARQTGMELIRREIAAGHARASDLQNECARRQRNHQAAL